MKKYIKSLFKHTALMVGLLAGFSCEEYLERTPEAVLSSEVAFKNFTNFQGFTEELYHCVPNFTNRYWTNSFNWGDDEIQSTAQNFHFGTKIENGDFWGWQSEFDGWNAGWMDRTGAFTPYENVDNNDARMFKGLWPLAWIGIRKANLGLANMDLMTDATQEERDLIEGQLLFFRGWFHFQLIQYFGGLPYVDALLPADEQLRLPRLSYQECAEKAAADLRMAADLLPVHWDETVAGSSTSGKNDLRINKIMALGYLGKNLLWAGSPLMNFESTGSRTYNADYCQRAAVAFAELIELCESGEAPYSLVNFEDYSSLFYTAGQNWAYPGADEAIFRSPYLDAHNSTYGTATQYTPAILAGGDVKFLPTANYVNFYGMANGLPLPDDVSQMDAASGYDPQFPWRDRDPRFYHDIIYDGVQVVQGSTNGQEELRYANLYSGGNYRDARTGSRTGYLNYKFVPITVNNFDNGQSYGQALNINVPYMRLADIYIMYAEAATMGYGSATGQAPGASLTAVDAINKIRDRAGVGEVDGQFLGSAEDFLEEVRRERAVELAFERHRFNDLRRWLLLIEEPYTLKTALSFDRPAAGMPTVEDTDDPSQNRVVNLVENVILERNFTEKHYWLPLKVADVSIYPELNQNPGW
ncbi:RagB/SusD family nutrient uptake outer membrane protein [Gilvimarinus agarilyticus]|uniref:RagB/SusD family nutrient uptake outer membrane protein n=1 Tax=Reichenbachiella agariperforans TaxID=156994 RepID=UPI001C08727D|nr:RagB/SusD family nutrient uptake outer membrane protein [Reichenbachiella agariperforans]MBU2886069.1 RagB/SusD family nutrient uptake outer membrane protein [Gilvimarinus agarilyticus]MBU2913527.1 RagB/SusD family nutrient uptake outer membrane protein [Reichenbachiella agariperforans]